jgi:hypothetical protein
MHERSCQKCRFGDRHKLLNDLMCFHPKLSLTDSAGLHQKFPQGGKGREGLYWLNVRNNDAQCGPQGSWWDPKMIEHP